MRKIKDLVKDLVLEGRDKLFAVINGRRTVNIELRTIADFIFNFMVDNKLINLDDIETNENNKIRVVSLDLPDNTEITKDVVAQNLNQNGLTVEADELVIVNAISNIINYKEVPANIRVDACDFTPPISPSNTYYFKGEGDYPVVGDIIYTDNKGVNPLSSRKLIIFNPQIAPDGYIGIQTNASGIVELLNCNGRKRLRCKRSLFPCDINSFMTDVIYWHEGSSDLPITGDVLYTTERPEQAAGIPEVVINETGVIYDESQNIYKRYKTDENGVLELFDCPYLQSISVNDIENPCDFDAQTIQPNTTYYYDGFSTGNFIVDGRVYSDPQGANLVVSKNIIIIDDRLQNRAVAIKTDENGMSNPFSPNRPNCNVLSLNVNTSLDPCTINDNTFSTDNQYYFKGEVIFGMPESEIPKVGYVIYIDNSLQTPLVNGRFTHREFNNLANNPVGYKKYTTDSQGRLQELNC